MLILDSAVQLGGVAMVIVGAVTRHREWNPPVVVAPMAVRDGAGVALAFRF